MAGKPSAVTQAGLDATLSQDSKHKWHLVLTDDAGIEVFNGGPYSSDASAKASASQWVRKHYQVETQEVPAPAPAPEPRPKPKKRASPYTTGKTPTASHLNRLLNLRADRNEEKAIALRTQADALETEAKRLREAADTLAGGPDGQT